jgi:hypothetical protein
MPGRKKHVDFFVSYAHRDAKQKTDLLVRLDAFLRMSNGYDYSLWHDGHILLGEDWNQEIVDALDACHFGLLLISPSFLTSRFIADVELPPFVGPRAVKPVLPVALGRLVLDRMDLKGLEARQLFFHNGKCYARCANGRARDDFSEALFVAIENRLDRFFARGARGRAGR